MADKLVYTTLLRVHLVFFFFFFFFVLSSLMLGLLLYVKEKVATCKMAMNFEPLLYYTPKLYPTKDFIPSKRGHCQFSMKHNNKPFHYSHPTSKFVSCTITMYIQHSRVL
jgi:hypothetical protein